MKKSLLIIIIIILFSDVNITSGQENSLSPSTHTITFNNKQSVAWMEKPEPAAFNHLKELSPEELNLITGEGSGNFLIFNDNQTNLPWIILWDEISTQKNTSTNRSVELINTWYQNCSSVSALKAQGHIKEVKIN